MAIIYTKEYNGQIIKINDTYFADPAETYTNEARTAYTIHSEGAAQGMDTYFQTPWTFLMPDSWIVQIEGSGINPMGKFTKALYFSVGGTPEEPANTIVLAIAGNDIYNILATQQRDLYLPDYNLWSVVYSSDMQATFSTNLPIFEDKQTAEAYCNETNEIARQVMIQTLAVNYVDKDFDEETKYYYIENRRGLANCVRNTATQVAGATWESMRFAANKVPMLYYNDNNYSLTLKAGAVVSSIASDVPLHIIDMMPDSQWTDYDLEYTGLWYGNIASRMNARNETLPDGEYMYGFEFNTNILIFKDEETADAAEESGDYSEAINYSEITGGGGYQPPEDSLDEEATIFGGGADTSPFVATYVLSRNGVLNVANKWYTDDPDTWQDILTGISMTGDKPYEAIAGLTLYPFDVNTIVSTVEQHHIYFGSYEMPVTGTSLYKVNGLKPNAYLDCGTVFLYDTTASYRSFEPYTQLDVFLPYIGWERLDLALFVNRWVNVRYFVDIHTRACTACILAGKSTSNMVLIAQFGGTIGVGLPVTSSDFQGYANAMCSTILGGAGNIAQSAGAMYQGAMGLVSGAGVGTSLLTTGIGIAGAAVHTAATINQLERQGKPQDHASTKGTFTSGIGTYMPQYVIFRYTIHETIEPDDYANICGIPSNESGYISSFSGFLSCKQVKLNTTGMLDKEAAEIYSLLKGGIYL